MVFGVERLEGVGELDLLFSALLVLCREISGSAAQSKEKNKTKNKTKQNKTKEKEKKQKKKKKTKKEKTTFSRHSRYCFHFQSIQPCMRQNITF